jgi:urease accessory protein
MATLDLPVLIRCQQACAHADMTRVQALDQWLMAWRETAELAAADLEMGANLLRLLQALAPGMMRPEQPLGWVSAWGLAANHWRVALPDSLRGFLWSWVENQLVAASKCMPFGQTDIQRSLIALNGPMSIAIEQAMVIEDEEMGTGLPGLAWLSAAHETQYSRLFRS